MQPYLEERFGNPSSVYTIGRIARAAIDDARDEIAQLLGARSKEIIFTSGGTESNNLAIFGAVYALKSKGQHIVTCTTEHHSVLHPCQHLIQEGFEITFIPVDAHGKIDLETFSHALRPDTILVSIMSANNETGTHQAILEMGALCREHRVLFHCDAIQSFGKEQVNVEEWKVDLLSITAHKFYGPKGIAALYIRTGTPLQPSLIGGSHENERRAGTENVAAIVGMATAARLTTKQTEEENCRLFDLTEKLWNHLSTAIPHIHRNGHPVDRLGNTLNVSFEGCDGEGLIMGLDLEGIAVSSGSACMVGSLQSSHVLKAMGLKEQLARAAVRFSLGTNSREKDLPEIIKYVVHIVEQLRHTSPFSSVA